MIQPRLDKAIHAPNRLRICAILASAQEAEFRKIRDELAVSDSVLSRHIKQLADAGYIIQRRRKHGSRHHTWVRLSVKGRRAFEAHSAELRRLTEPPSIPATDNTRGTPDPTDPTIGQPVRRKRLLDEARLIEAVLAVGFERLTIASVAKHLGTAHSAVYHHVKDRSVLLGLTVDHLINTTAWPPLSSNWRETLREYATTFWDLLDNHPGLALEITVHSMPSLSYQRLIHTLIQHLTSLGFTAHEALLGVDLVMDLTIDASLRAHFQEMRFPADDPDAFRDWFLKKVDVAIAGIADSKTDNTSQQNR